MLTACQFCHIILGRMPILEANAFEFFSRSPDQTRRVGLRLGALLKTGDLICLDGDLGSGKTTLAQAIAEGAGVDEREYVNSPTFAVLHEYGGRIPIYHMDFYRLGSSEDVLALGLDEYLYGDGLALIEWFERAEDVLPESVLVVHLSFVNTNSRAISLHSSDHRWQKIIGQLKTTLNLS